jgi:acyl CoA:acetate/3-ketoacid CoA transferase beta subunit
VADDVVIVTTLTARRTVERVPYVTSPGARVSHLVTDLATFEKREGRFVLTAAVGGHDGIAAVRDVCGWELAVADVVAELEPPTPQEVETLRRWDPRGFFLRA